MPIGPHIEFFGPILLLFLSGSLMPFFQIELSKTHVVDFSVKSMSSLSFLMFFSTKNLQIRGMLIEQSITIYADMGSVD